MGLVMMVGLAVLALGGIAVAVLLAYSGTPSNDRPQDD